MYTTDGSEIAIAELKLFFLKRGKKITNKVDLINQSVIVLSKLLKDLDEESINQLIDYGN
jgi:hypothetical protein